jgi:coniferyl-aldehyde dehydrogenase
MQRAHLAAGPASAALRRDRLERAASLLISHRVALERAISADFGHRAAYQTLAIDIVSTVAGLRHSAAQVGLWMERDVISVPDAGVQAWIEPQPVGVVGIVSPWSLPINLAFAPLAGAFAAGNTALIKPSEFTPRTSDLLGELVGAHFDADELGVVIGGPDVAEAFTHLPFDHLVFTGSTHVGKIVMQAAAENLVPVTLALGGKCPVVIDQGFDVATAAERVLKVKTFNAGQIYLSPDYVMLNDDQVDGFVAAARAFVARAFPAIQGNDDYTSVIAPRHYDRLLDLISDAQAKGAKAIPLAPEGEPFHRADTRKIAPVILLGVDETMRVMQEEIFGPILPLLTLPSVEAAIARITAHDRPLAAYLFSDSQASRDKFAAGVTSGALVINDVMLHANIDALPLGGVGASGMGAYHGAHGFRRFSHMRPVVAQTQGGASGESLRAPYGPKLAAIEGLLGGKN